MSWKKGTFLQVKAGWYRENEDCVSLGPDIELSDSTVSWTPVRFYGEDDPDWFKTRGLEKRPKNKHAGHV